MSIIRAPRPKSNFYHLDKRISEDKRLSWAARGMLIFLLGKPDHWKVSVQALVRETVEAMRSTGRDAVYNLLSELIDTGYVKRIKHADGAVEYLVCEPSPENTEQGREPVPEKPDPEKPDPENQDALVITDQAVRIEEIPRNELELTLEPPPSKPTKSKGNKLTLQQYFDACKAKGEKPMDSADPINKWAKTVGVPSEFLYIAWYVFKQRYVDDTGKRQADWRAHFRNAVKRNWYRLWFFDQGTGECRLTTAGEQANREYDALLQEETRHASIHQTAEAA